MRMNESFNMKSLCYAALRSTCHIVGKALKNCGLMEPLVFENQLDAKQEVGRMGTVYLLLHENEVSERYFGDLKNNRSIEQSHDTYYTVRDELGRREAAVGYAAGRQFS